MTRLGFRICAEFILGPIEDRTLGCARYDILVVMLALVASIHVLNTILDQ